MDQLTISIHASSCEHDGVSLGGYKEALEREFGQEFDVKFEVVLLGGDLQYQYGYTGFRTTNAKAKKVEQRVVKVYRTLLLRTVG